MAKPFRNISDALDRDPESRARIEQYKQAIYDTLALVASREPDGTSLEREPEGQITRRSCSTIGREHGPYLSALEGHVAELGGRLEVKAVFPDGEVLLLVGAEQSADLDP
jgi:hypothetical protein